MSRGGEPVQLPRVRPRALMLVAIASAAVGGWAFWPTQPATFESPDVSAPESLAPPTELPVLEASAFHAPLWVAQAPPPLPPAAAPPPPPLKLQLIAIVHENGQYRAALYDPDSDELKVVSSGDKLGTRIVAGVAKDSVTISEGKLIRTLALDLKQRGTP